MSNRDHFSMVPELASYDALRAGTLPWWKILAEFIDNAYQNGARNVVIRVGRGGYDVEDDGWGQEDIGLLFRLGSGDHRTREGIGRWGVGAKEAANQTGSQLRVDSWTGMEHLWAEVDFEALVEGGLAASRIPVNRCESLGKPGLKLTIGGKRRKTLNLRTLNAVKETLAWVYGPSLDSGRNIIIIDKGGNEERLMPAIEPEVQRDSQRIHAVEVEIDRNRSLVLDAGRVAGVNAKPFLNVIFAGRVVAENETMGLGDDPPACLYGRVELRGKWELTKNKDNLFEADKDLIDQAIAPLLAPLVRHSRELSYDIQIKDFAHRVEMLIPSLVERRRPAGGEGTHDRGCGDERPRQKNDVHRDMAPGTGIKVQFTRMGIPGDVFVAKPKKVVLNLSYPQIERMFRQNQVAGTAMLTLAAYAIGNYRDKDLLQNLSLEFDTDVQYTITQLLGALFLKSAQTMTGRD